MALSNSEGVPQSRRWSQWCMLLVSFSFTTAVTQVSDTSCIRLQVDILNTDIMNGGSDCIAFYHMKYNILSP